MNRLNKTESVVFLYCRFFVFLKDQFFQIICRKTIAGARGDRIILLTTELNRGEPMSIVTNLVNASLPSRISSRTLRRL